MVATTNKVALRQLSTVYDVRFRKYGQVVFFSGLDAIPRMPVSRRVFNLRAQTKRNSLSAAAANKDALLFNSIRYQVRKVRPKFHFSGVDIIFSTGMPVSQRVFVGFAKPKGS